jgi:MFS transporter, DHA1 family, inner membrane transport protein
MYRRMHIPLWRRIEVLLTGALPADVARNMRIDLLATSLYGPFYAALLFIPVVLQRLGASSEQVAIYQAQSYLGFFLAPFSLMLMPRQRILVFLAGIWSIGRAVFLLTPLVDSVPGLLLICGVFWLSDSFPSPGYIRVMQQIYPATVRARAMSAVRFGMALCMLAFTPVAGWLLDVAGHATLLPIAALFGIVGALIFARIRIPNNRAADADSAAAVDTADALASTPPRLSMLAMLQLLRRNRPYLLYLLSITAFGFAGLIPIAFFPAVLVDRLQLSYSAISWLGLAQSLLWLVGYVVWGRWMDKLGGVRTLQLVYAMLILYPLCHWFAQDAWWLVPAYLASGLANAGVDLAFTSVTIDLADEGRVTEFAALQRTVIGFRGIVGPLIGVALSNAGVSMPMIFVLSIALYVFAIALLAHPALRRTSYAATPGDAR